jgi:fatty-acyl-CoA synthase
VRVDWATFDRRIRRLASGLRRRGIEPGDVVAARLANRPEWFYLFGACSQLGALFAPLQTRLGPSEVEAILESVAPACLVESSSTSIAFESIAPDPPELRAELEADHDPDVAGFAADEPLSSVSSPSSHVDDPALLLHTSGTTGAPRGVCHTWRTLLWNHRQFVDGFELTADDVHYCVAPLAHAAGANVPTGPLLYLGGTIVLADQFDPDRMADALRTRDVTCTFMVPAMWKTLLRALERPLESPDFRFGVVGGAPVSGRLVERARRRGLHLVEGYGMTEAGPMVSLLDASDPARHDRSVGWPGMHVDVRIVDDEGERCEPGERGEIQVRGPNVVDAYWNDGGATRDSFREGGWFRTGDLGVARGGAEFDVVGRIDDMIVSGGENIHPFEVESRIAELETVRAVGVVGTDHPAWGEAVTAAIVPADGTEGPTLDEVREVVRAELAGYKAPRRLALVESLPENPTGKLDRARLRAQLEEDVPLREYPA